MLVNSVQHDFLCNNSGLSVLLHDFISLPGATSNDKTNCSDKSPFFVVGVAV